MLVAYRLPLVVAATGTARPFVSQGEIHVGMNSLRYALGIVEVTEVLVRHGLVVADGILLLVTVLQLATCACETVKV